jgi:ADP-ribosylglycohydrolase
VVEDLRRRQWESVSRSGFGQTAPPPELYPARPQPGRLIHDAAALRRAQGCLLGQIAGDSAAGQPGPHAELALVLARRLVLDGDCRVDSAAAGYAAWRNGWTHSLEPLACDHAWCLPPDASLVDEHASDDAGALMRVSPLGIWGAFRNSAHVAQAARRDAALTHPSPLAQAASAVFAVTLAAAIREGLDPPRTLAFALSWASDQRLDERIVGALQHARHAPPSGPASVLTSLQHAFFQLLHTTTFADPASGALLGAVHGREAIPGQLQRMVLSSRPLYGQPGVQRPRPAVYWPTDALVLAERLLASGR